MKKIKLLFGFLLFVAIISAQTNILENSSYYYYKGEKNNLPISKNRFVVYFDITKISISEIKQEFEITNEIQLPDTTLMKLYACEIMLPNHNYDSIWHTLIEKPFVIDVEPVIDEENPVMVSSLLYVKLKSEEDYSKLLQEAERLNATIVRQLAYAKKWYVLEVNKKSFGNSIVVSNYLWETKLFDQIDPGFILNFQPNFSNCVSDSSFSQQWGMHSINTCNAWNITTGDTNIKIAIIDMGIDETHQEFSGIHNSGSFHSVTQTSPAVVLGNHGTYVSGVIFANHNSHQIAGVAPNCSMLNISHDFANRTTTVEELADGFVWAVLHDADIINNSWSIAGGNINSTLLEDAIDDVIDNGRNGKGCIVVFSSGILNSAQMSYPANYRREILVVGAIDSNYDRITASNYGNLLDVVAPGKEIYSTTPNNTYNYINGTSMAAPHVSGVAALMLSVNPNLTGQQVRDIIEQTAQKINADYYLYQHDVLHFNGTWDYELGYGLVDAYAAVLKAMDEKIDLYIKDDISDDGTEPNMETNLWYGPDIWLEDSIGRKIENPADATTYKVCVRIHNRSTYASIGSEKLFLNWAKAGINDYWSESWTGENLLPCGLPQGGIIGNANGISIPSIPADSSIVMKIPWTTPSGYDYAGCTNFQGDPWHFCLLARVHDNDTINHENETHASVYEMIKNHNNVAQVNIYFIKSTNSKTVIRTGNPTENNRYVNLGGTVTENNQGENISSFADIELSFDDNIISAAQRDDVTGAIWIDSTDNIYTLRITDFDNFNLPMVLAPEQYGTILTTVHFYADTIPLDSVFTFNIILYEAEGNIAGGQHYNCTRNMDRYFQAEIQGNVNLIVNDSTTLYAVTIGEPADYVWYDAQGNVIGTDSFVFIPIPFQATTYTLSITAHSDGYRAITQEDFILEYDSSLIIIDEPSDIITSIAPNPANGQVSIEYNLPENTEQVILQILNTQGQKLYTQTIGGNRETTNKQIVSTSNFAAGQYKVQIINKKGKILDNKTLIINK